MKISENVNKALSTLFVYNKIATVMGIIFGESLIFFKELFKPFIESNYSHIINPSINNNYFHFLSLFWVFIFNIPYFIKFKNTCLPKELEDIYFVIRTSNLGEQEKRIKYRELIYLSFEIYKNESLKTIINETESSNEPLT